MSDTTFTGLIWAKVATNGIGEKYTNLKFSGNGQKIIVHSYASVGTILIVDSVNGNLLNARTYSKSYFNVNSAYNHLLLSSTSLAYVYSLNKGGHFSCGGH